MPPTSGPFRYMWWLVISQAGRSSLGALLGSVWMAGLAATPYLLKRAIDDGLDRHDRGALLWWSGALLASGAANTYVSIMRHRTMTKIRLDAVTRTVRVIVAHATRLGAELPRRLSAGEVVTIGMSDVTTIAQALTVVGPGVGSVVAYVIVAVLLLSISPLLGVVVLAGVPTIALAIGPLLHRLQGRTGDYRTHQAALTARLVDIIAGLHVLAGLGGRDTYGDRYRAGSSRLRAEGYRVGAVTSWVQALGVGLPALFLAVVTWLGARMAVRGDITAGDLVAVYAYAAVLTVPVGFFIEASADFARAAVSARRTLALLRLAPATADGPDAVDAPVGPSFLVDPASGVRLTPGELTALVTAQPAEAIAIVDRLGRYADTDATWGGLRLDRVRLAEVRARILVADNEADLFAGPFRDVVAGPGTHDDDAVAAAVRAAVAEDVVAGLPDGLAGAVASGGRNLSGGQRQRVRMARALIGAPEVLLAVEPTSAVDTHTEAAMADRLRAARAGRTTLVTTTSPLMLDRADRVFLVVDGRAVADGPHHEMLARPDYRALVLRGQSDLDPVAAGGAQ